MLSISSYNLYCLPALPLLLKTTLKNTSVMILEGKGQSMELWWWARVFSPSSGGFTAVFRWKPIAFPHGVTQGSCVILLAMAPGPPRCPKPPTPAAFLVEAAGNAARNRGIFQGNRETQFNVHMLFAMHIIYSFMWISRLHDQKHAISNDGHPSPQ